MNDTTDWYAVESFGERDLRVVEAPRTMPCSLYLIRGADAAVLVDAGLGVGDLRAVVEAHVDVDVELVLTHTHWDHIGAAHQFDTVSVSERECPEDRIVAIDSLSDEFVQRPAQFVEKHRAAGEAFPDDFDPDAYAIRPAAGVLPVAAGDSIDLGDRTLEFVDVAGHSPGQLAVLDRERGVLHGGDVLHLDRDIYAHFEGSDVAQYRDTFERLVALRESGAFDVLTTGHNEPIAGDELSIFDRLGAGFDEILDGARPYETVETPWGDAHRYEIGPTEVLTPTSV